MPLHRQPPEQKSKGISDQAHALGYDVCVYSYFGLRAPDERTFHGETNILELIDTEQFDAFITNKCLIWEDYLRENIFSLFQKSGKPFFDLNAPDEPDTAYPIWNDRESFKALTEHLLTEHHFKKIYCITGSQDFHQSENRLLGYRDAMLAHGITPEEKWIYYGDFWKEFTTDFADRLASGEIEMPEAVACAATAPAISLIERLRVHKIRVPDDLAVVGYDFSMEGEYCDPTITSISFPFYNQGVHAMCQIHQALSTGINQLQAALLYDTHKWNA